MPGDFPRNDAANFAFRIDTGQVQFYVSTSSLLELDHGLHEGIRPFPGRVA